MTELHVASCTLYDLLYHICHIPEIMVIQNTIVGVHFSFVYVKVIKLNWVLREGNIPLHPVPPPPPICCWYWLETVACWDYKQNALTRVSHITWSVTSFKSLESHDAFLGWNSEVRIGMFFSLHINSQVFVYAVLQTISVPKRGLWK